VRYARKCHPDDLFVKYFTSSKKVHLLIEQEGLPDIIAVRKVFSKTLKARYWEETVLRRIGAVKSKKWLNQHNAGKYFTGGSCKGRVLSILHRAKIGNALRGKKLNLTLAQREIRRYNVTGVRNGMFGKTHTDEYKQKRSELMKINNPMFNPEISKKNGELRKGENHPYFGKNLSVDHCRKISESKKRKPKSIEHRKKLSIAQKNKVRSEEHCNNLSLATKNTKKVICEFCNIEVDVRNYSRWHGLKCKKNINQI
jgi:hypothetical protein